MGKRIAIIGGGPAGVEAALAPVIKLGATVADLAALYGPHPAISELVHIAARAAKERFL